MKRAQSDECMISRKNRNAVAAVASSPGETNTQLACFGKNIHDHDMALS